MHVSEPTVTMRVQTYAGNRIKVTVAESALQADT